MTITAEILVAAHPVFATKNVEEIEAAIAEAEDMCPWEDLERRDRGVRLLACHYLEMEWLEAANIVSASIALTGGKASSAPSGASGDFEADLDLTTYGRRWKQLRTVVVGPPILYFSGF
jgi:hypothetical protein